MKPLLQPRVIRYVASGAISFLVENVSFLFLFYTLGLHVAVSNVISICTAITVNFLVSKHFVFKSDKPKRARHQLVSYLILAAANLTVSTVLVSSLVHFDVAGYIAKPIVATMVACWTYFIYKQIIFKDREV